MQPSSSQATDIRRLRAEVSRLRDDNARLAKQCEQLQFKYTTLCKWLEQYTTPVYTPKEVSGGT